MSTRVSSKCLSMLLRRPGTRYDASRFGDPEACVRIRRFGLATVAFLLASCDSLSDRTTEILMFRPSDGKYALCSGNSGMSLPPFDQSMPAGVTDCVKQCNAVGYIEQGVQPSDAVLASARHNSCSPRSGG